VNGNNPVVDSVDGDDGVIDGSGTAGHDYATPGQTENIGLGFTFDALILGALPTHAGIVWTDGSFGTGVTFEAFDQNNVSLGFTTINNVGDNSFAGGTAEDRFFGVINAGGISRITIRDTYSGNQLVVDHLQYGRQGSQEVPEPGAWALLAGATLGGGLLFRRRIRR
jgi:hypothetical protein